VNGDPPSSIRFEGAESCIVVQKHAGSLGTGKSSPVAFCSRNSFPLKSEGRRDRRPVKGPVGAIVVWRLKAEIRWLRCSPSPAVVAEGATLGLWLTCCLPLSMQRNCVFDRSRPRLGRHGCLFLDALWAVLSSWRPVGRSLAAEVHGDEGVPAVPDSGGWS